MVSYMEYDKKSNSAVWKHFLREEKGRQRCVSILTTKRF